MTVATIIPNQTIVSSAGEVHPALVDADDATFVHIVPNFDHQFGMSTVVLPAGARIKSGQVVARGYNFGLGTPGVWDGAELTMVSSLRAAVGTVLASYAQTLPAGPVANVATVTSATAAIAADQATLDGVQFWGRINETPAYPAGPPVGLALTELSVNVVYATIPVVTVGAPTGSIVTANPVLTWTYSSDSDADATGIQQRFHIRVFTAAQYGADGFDPATSTAAYDSGEVVSNASYAPIGPFPDATTFKAYVRAAQNVNGAPHWSLWDDGAPFTTNTDPPQVDAVTVTPTDPAVHVTARRDTAHSDWTHVNVERSTDNTSWEPVRGALAVAAPDDTVTVNDYEMPEGVKVWYRARGITMSGAAVLSQGDWTTTGPIIWTLTEQFCGGGCGEWLRAPDDPDGAVLIEVVVDEATTTTAHRVGLLDVIGRSSPVTVWDVPSLAAGTLTTVTRTYTDGAALLTLIRTAPVLLWQGRHMWGHPHRWLVITGHQVSRHPSADSMFTDYRQWDITYVEVDAPVVLS